MYVISVSYTHLDVYKRQPLSSVIRYTIFLCPFDTGRLIFTVYVSLCFPELVSNTVYVI